MSERRLTRQPSSRGAATLGLIMATGLLTGCYNTETTPEESADCAAVELEAWTGVPQNLNADLVAERLGTSVGKIMKGAMGQVTCKAAIPVENIETGAPVTVSGIPDEFAVTSRCLAIISGVPPSPGATAINLGVVCPAN